jgi:hypothetical protein
VFKNADGSYDWFSFAGDNDQYGTLNGYTEATGVAIGDLNGDGMNDIVEASFLSPTFIEDGLNISQNYFLWSTENSQQMDAPTNMNVSRSTLFNAALPGYSIALGNIYSDSELPDIVHGMLDGSVNIFANQGMQNGVFSGFRLAATFNVPPQCQIRDIAIGSLAPCTISLVTALYCLTESGAEGNYMFNADVECPPTSSPWPTWSPTVSSWPTTTPWPTTTAALVENTDTSPTVSEVPNTNSPSLSPNSSSGTNSPSLLSTPKPTSTSSMVGTGEELSGSPTVAPSLLPSTASMTSDYPSLVPSSEPSLGSTTTTSSTSSSSSSSPTSMIENTPVPTKLTTESPSTDTGPQSPSSAPNPYIESNENIDLDDFGPTQTKNSESENNLWQFMALGLSIGMVIAGCIGIAKVAILIRRRAKRNSSEKSDAISLYMERDELEALERR